MLLIRLKFVVSEVFSFALDKLTSYNNPYRLYRDD